MLEEVRNEELETSKEWKPLIVAFACNWCSYAGADLAGTSRLSYPAEVKIIKVPCSCRVDPIFVMRAFGKGADGVIVCGCHPGDCHYSTGNYYTRRRFTLLFNLLEFMGIERERMRLEWISAAEATKFAKIMNEFTDKIKELGPNSRLVDLRNVPEGQAESWEVTHTYPTPYKFPTINTDFEPKQAQIEEEMRKRARQLLESGEVDRVLAWKAGDFDTMPEPAFFTNLQQLDDLVYNRFCSANLSKYLMVAPWLGGKQDKFDKTAIFLRPCDSFSFNQLIKENRTKREHVHIIGIGCGGVVAVEEMEEVGLYEKCTVCEKTEHPVYDELIGAELSTERTQIEGRFDMVERIEKLTPEERFKYWQGQLYKCIRCNACRNTCPVCNCKKCVFSSEKYDITSKANATDFEGQMFHIIRAFHVAGRCSDCGECSRVCPQGIPIHLLNRKFIKDINEYYGEFQAGLDIEAPEPLTSFNAEGDAVGHNRN